MFWTNIRISVAVVIIIISGLFSPTAQATSGACSWHGGVNCGVGSDFDGSVVCNDGWRDSTVSFNSMTECDGKVSCTSTELESLRTKYNIKEQEQSYDQLKQQANEKLIEMNLGISQEGQRLAPMSIISRRQQVIQEQGLAEVNALLSQAKIIQDSMRFDLSLVEQECSAMGQDRLFQQKAEAILRNIESTKKLIVPLNENIETAETQKKEETVQTYSCTTYGENSVLTVDNKCICKDGYSWNTNKTQCIVSLVCSNGFVKKNNQCLTYTQDCMQGFGQNVYGTKGTDNNSICYCNDGYEWAVDRKTCVKKIVLPPVVPLTPPKPIITDTAVIRAPIVDQPIKQESEGKKILDCKDGFSLSLDRSFCVKIPEHAHTVTNKTDVWLCDEGYKEINNLCVKQELSSKKQPADIVSQLPAGPTNYNAESGNSIISSFIKVKQWVIKLFQ